MQDTRKQREKIRDEMIRHFEGNRLDAYLDSEHIPTIGTGATSYEDGTPVRMGDSITEDRSEELLRFHLDRANSRVREMEGYQMLPPNAKAAVDSFAFNSGPNFMDGGFETITEAIKSGDERAVADALSLYTNGGTPGLVRRREAEAALALTPAMDPVDSTLANDRTRKFGTEAVLNGETVKWGGEDYGWQSPESFATIEAPVPETQFAGERPGIKNLFGLIK